MKISAINMLNSTYITHKTSDGRRYETCSAENFQNITSLNCMPCYYPTFSGIQNSSKLRALFAYFLPCIYSGIPMIDPKVLTKMQKSNLFYKPAETVLKELDKYKGSFIGNEEKLIQILRERALVHPNYTIKDIMNEIKPVYSRRLRKKQTPVFYDLIELSKKLPEKYRYKFTLLMADTNKKLDERPVLIPFSSYEFKYKLSKIQQDIINSSDLKAKKVMNKLLKESKRFSNTTSQATLDNQKKVLDFLEIILNKSVLKENIPLRNLIDISRRRLNKEEIVVPFTRKSFIYDLAKIIEDLPNKKLQEKFIKTALKLPTSTESFSAYVMKLSAEQPEKIGHRIVWPSLASVEHLLPRSEGGADVMSNFAGATTLENSLRKSIKFTQQIKLRPDTPKYCQMYVDKLIDLYYEGIFARHNVNPRYITDFAKTIYELSDHRIKLDTSRFKPGVGRR